MSGEKLWLILDLRVLLSKKTEERCIDCEATTSQQWFGGYGSKDRPMCICKI